MEVEKRPRTAHGEDAAREGVAGSEGFEDLVDFLEGGRAGDGGGRVAGGQEGGGEG